MGFVGAADHWRGARSARRPEGSESHHSRAKSFDWFHRCIGCLCSVRLRWHLLREDAKRSRDLRVDAKRANESAQHSHQRGHMLDRRLPQNLGELLLPRLWRIRRVFGASQCRRRSTRCHGRQICRQYSQRLRHIVGHHHLVCGFNSHFWIQFDIAVRRRCWTCDRIDLSLRLHTETETHNKTLESKSERYRCGTRIIAAG